MNSFVKKRLFTLILSVIVTVAMIVPVLSTSSVYAAADPQACQLDIKNSMGDPIASFKITEGQGLGCYIQRDNYNVEFSGTMSYVIQKQQDTIWQDEITVDNIPVGNSDTSIIYINNEYEQTGNKFITLGVGRYKAIATYNGDSYYNPITSNPYEFEILPSDPIITPIIKINPKTFVGVASGNTKNGKLNAALAVPTVSFSLSPVNGFAPTGSITFTLQRKSGSKWKAVSKKTVKLINSKASYKLTKASDAATYRVQMSYSGDNKYTAVTTNWTTVKIAKAKGTLKNKAKVYKKASTKSKKITTFKKAKKVTITGKSGKYYKVSFKLKGKTKTGYIAKKYIKVKK